MTTQDSTLPDEENQLVDKSAPEESDLSKEKPESKPAVVQQAPVFTKAYTKKPPWRKYNFYVSITALKQFEEASEEVECVKKQLDDAFANLNINEFTVFPKDQPEPEDVKQFEWSSKSEYGEVNKCVHLHLMIPFQTRVIMQLNYDKLENIFRNTVGMDVLVHHRIYQGVPHPVEYYIALEKEILDRKDQRKLDSALPRPKAPASRPSPPPKSSPPTGPPRFELEDPPPVKPVVRKKTEDVRPPPSKPVPIPKPSQSSVVLNGFRLKRRV